jgi:hypothetical protein
MINDVARAFFEAPVKRNICVELPAEEGARSDEVGRLKQSLYGTRDASANFQEEVRVVLTRAGFGQVEYNPSLYYHPGRHIRTLVHGDDFSSVGSSRELRWMRLTLEARFEISTKVVGQWPGMVEEARLLNRIIRRTEDGWEYEADQRHAELIVKGWDWRKPRLWRRQPKAKGPGWPMRRRKSLAAKKPESSAG